jgi:aerobic-type carbon monoxide dehydrogenase small subunit (CoxS/CutS family)
MKTVTITINEGKVDIDVGEQTNLLDVLGMFELAKHIMLNKKEDTTNA